MIEHLAVPGRVLDEAGRVLKPGGRIVITTPFGVLHHHDHKQTFFPNDVLALISARFGVVEAGITDRYFRIVGELGADTLSDTNDILIDQAFLTVRAIQEELAATRIRANRLEGDLKKSAADLTNAVATWETRHDKVKAAWQESKLEAQQLKSETQAAIRRADLADKMVESVSKELQTANQRADRVARENIVLRRKSDSLAKRADKLEYQKRVSDWKLASMRNRRWWQLGGLLGEARRHPGKLVALPVNAMRLARSRTPALPRPPRALKATSSDNDKPGSPAGRHSALVDARAPRLDVPVAAILSPTTSELLRFEVQLFDLNPDTWATEMTQIAPQALMAEPAALVGWPTDALTSLLSVCRTQNIRTILWSPNGAGPQVAEGFDKIVASNDTLDSTGTMKAQGLIQPALHNPIGGHSPDLRAATVDFSEMRIGESAGLSRAELQRIAKKYRVLTAAPGITVSDAALIVASGTPLIVQETDLPFGVVGPTEDERNALASAIGRSEVLGARMFHPQRRQLFRHHAVSGDVGQAIGKAKLANEWPQIDVMVATKRPERLEEVMANLGRQTYPNLRLFLVAHGVDLDKARVAGAAAEFGVNLADVSYVAETTVLGDVFNIGFAGTESEIIAKIDDDDFYGPEYFWDLYSALDFSGAEVAGKWAHYVYLEGIDSLIYRFKKYENRFTDVVAISTLLMRRSVLDLEQFPAMPYGSGSVFLRALGQHGVRVFAADRWNYLYVRGQDGGGNTFPISDMKMLTNSEIVCRGMNVDEVVV